MNDRPDVLSRSATVRDRLPFVLHCVVGRLDPTWRGLRHPRDPSGRGAAARRCAHDPAHSLLPTARDREPRLIPWCIPVKSENNQPRRSDPPVSSDNYGIGFEKPWISRSVDHTFSETPLRLPSRKSDQRQPIPAHKMRVSTLRSRRDAEHDHAHTCNATGHRLTTEPTYISYQRVHQLPIQQLRAPVQPALPTVGAAQARSAASRRAVGAVMGARPDAGDKWTLKWRAERSAGRSRLEGMGQKECPGASGPEGLAWKALT